MQIKEYLESEGRTIKWLAKKTGIHASAISKFICARDITHCGLKKPTAMAIHKATDGKVTAWELMFPEFNLQEVKQKRKYTKKDDCDESSAEIS